jgi:hypothetical protein
MKTNKKVVLGFAVAMVFSLAFMQGNSMKTNKQNVNVQQLTYTAAYQAVTSEGGAHMQTAWALTAGYGQSVTSGLISAAWSTGLVTPAGLIFGCAAICTAA